MNNFSLPIANNKLNALLGRLSREEAFVFLETTRVNAENFTSYLFLKPVDRLLCKASDDPAVFLERVNDYLGQGYYLAGWLAYEFGYLLEPVLQKLSADGQKIVADLGVFPTPHLFDHRAGKFVGSAPFAKDGPVSPSHDVTCKISGLRLSQSKDEYLHRIAEIKSFIETGDTYQVNYTLKFLFDFSGSASGLYETLRRNQSVSYGAFIKSGQQRILSFSPELFFRKSGSECVVRPMKGTSRRAPQLTADRVMGCQLAADSKNRSENVMIVDLLRNDLGRLCKMGKVEVVSLFDIETYETLHQMTSSVRGELRDGVTLEELFRAIFPCGSVTGAPKIRTMEIIKELEDGDRGVYTGGIGFISPVGDMVFNVPIRTVVLENGRGEMGTGSGIVYDSDPENEWDECCLKARFLAEPEPDFQLIETILWHPEKGFWLLERHLERLSASAVYWGMPCDKSVVKTELEKAVAGFRQRDGFLSEQDPGECLRIRLLLHKDGVLETALTPCREPVMWHGVNALNGGEMPVVVVASSVTDSRDSFLYHKTTRRPLYDSERQNAVGAGHCEVLFLNERGELTEGSISNVFIVQGNRLLTPPLSSGLLNGILRQSLLAGEVSFRGLQLKEKVLTEDDLKAAEAIYVGNSVRGMVRVKLVDKPAD